jgi:cyclophilin family peptidyl-prolyl cis-trans isomerase
MDDAKDARGAEAHPLGLRHRLRLLVALSLALALASLSCAEREAPAASGAYAGVPAAATPRDVAVLAVEGFGEIRIELLGDLAPQTAAHFVALAERGTYDGTSFHRVIPGFMIQAGDPNTRDRDPRDDGQGGQQERVPDERPAVSHTRGIVALANRGIPNSGGTQFFILVADAPHLDGEYAVFGRVIEGIEVADRIAAVERDRYGRHGPIDRPTRNVVVTDVRIERAASSTAQDANPERVS